MHPILYLLRQHLKLSKKQEIETLKQGYAPTLHRNVKAQNIMALLSEHLDAKLIGMRILDIGCGNGEISLYLAQAGNQVASCDVQLPQVTLPFFVQLTDARLPFADGSFDVVVYNHVMEHLAQKSDQVFQLREIYRVLKDDGCCYFAQPNRIFPWEAHTRLWFLHWFPNPVWFSLAKALGKYQEDIFLHGTFSLKRMIRKIGFRFTEYTAKIIANPTLTVHTANRYTRINKKEPNKWLRFLQFLSPISIFIIEKRRESE